ncbi:MAG: TrbG/VirB9 family P-type conjugative transfer protein [Betaproteobacteria bacterium]|nr:TrbG/VirB9 family P-type conjugative transfer protein [Betaproteobacteria bacterium]
MRNFRLLPLTFLLLASCAAQRPQPQKLSAVLAHYHFSYRMTDRRAVSLIQVFDDGTRTYLQFKEPYAAPVITADNTNTPLPYSRQGLFAIVDGVYSSLTVTTVGHRTVVHNDSRGALTPLPAPVAAVIHRPRVESLPPALVPSPTPPASHPATPFLASLWAAPGGRSSVGFDVPFARRALRLGPEGDAVLNKAAPIAAAAQHITLYGRATSGNAESLCATDRRALQRAWLVMADLVRHGADPGKFRVFYSGKKGVDLVEVRIDKGATSTASLSGASALETARTAKE